MSVWRSYLTGFGILSTVLGAGIVIGYFFGHYIDEIRNLDSLPKPSIVNPRDFNGNLDQGSKKSLTSEVLKLEVDDFEYEQKNGEFLFKGRFDNGDACGSKITTRDLHRNGKRDVSIYFYREKKP